jgi:hypothetical protein
MIKAGVLVIGSLTTSIKLMMFTPFFRVYRILISLLIFVFFTITVRLDLLTRLKDLDNNPFVVESVDSFIHLRVLSSTNLLDDLIILL